MFKKPFVILDLETSGTDPKKDDIIEVAMIRYENGKEVMRYDDLIKIDYALPKIITIITGISDKDISENGKDSGVVFDEIEKVLKGAYLVGHNINFDAGFLKSHKVEMDILGLIDTIPLAQILYPKAVSYSLESLTDDLDIKHVNRHRAMGDVEATLELFKRMCDDAEKLPVETINEIQKYLDRSTWDGGVVFEETKGSATAPQIAPQGLHDSSAGIRKALEVEEILSEGGVLQKFWEEYEPRDQQVTMAKNVMNAFELGYHLICEAPTGVGKSLGYLIPSANIAIRNKSKVVISTNTINLQEQLYEKDVPLLQKIYREGTNNHGVTAAILKGRKHYLCLRRFAKFKERQRFSDEEIILLIKILVWQVTTVSGDSGEIHLTKGENMIWDFELCSDKKYCSPQKCRPYGECYLQRARKKAEDADIIIVNHALLCADLESDGSLLPEYQYLVIDEAHNFEEASTDAFGMRLEQDNLSLPMKLIVMNLENLKRKNEGTLFGGQLAIDKISECLESSSDIRNSIDNLFSIIALFVNNNVQDSGYVENLLVDLNILGMEEWLNLSVSAEQTCKELGVWLKKIKDLADMLLLAGLPEAEQNEILMEILQEADLLAEQNGALINFFADEPKSKFIKWMTSDSQGTVTVNLAPYLPGEALKEKLYTKKKSIILTSATLSIKLKQKDVDNSEQHPFNYIRTVLDLDDKFEELIIDSPFDFETQTYVLVPDNALPISSPKSSGELAVFFEKLIKKIGGGMLSLFTSYKMIETLYLSLMEEIQGSGIRMLAQRISGGRNKIIKAYMNDPTHSVLFGTSSFWEGVDIKGEALTTLVIHKLPFDVPTDPVCKARCQMFGNGFYEYSVPRAILKFRQGFGRLIRSKSDYGVMIVLDNRVLGKDYGRFFLEALPPNVTLEKMKLLDIPEKVKEWLDINKEQRKSNF